MNANVGMMKAVPVLLHPAQIHQHQHNRQDQQADMQRVRQQHRHPRT